MTDLFSYSSLDYPHGAAGAKRVGPSEEAAKAVTHTRGDAHDAILKAYEYRGPMTADEASAACGFDILYGRPRVSELVAMGKLVDTGTRRKNEGRRCSATVWDLP